MKKLNLTLVIWLMLNCLLYGQYKFEQSLLFPFNNYLYSQDLDSNSSNYIATGFINISSKDKKDIMLVNWHENFGYNWVKRFNGPGNNDDIGRHIMKTQDGGYLISGTTSSTTGGNNFDGFTLKLDGSCNVAWFKYFGNSFNDYAYSSCEDSSHYYVAGSFGTNSSETNTNAFIFCFNKNNGSVVWGKEYIDQDSLYFQRFNSIIIGYNSNLIVTGTSNDANGTAKKIVCAEINRLNGNIVWNYKYNTTGRGYISSVNIIKGHSNQYIITGTSTTFYNRLLLLNLYSNGIVNWNKAYYYNNLETQGIQTVKTNTGYTAYGVTRNFGSDDIYLMNTDTSGVLNWLRYYHGSPSVEGSLSFNTSGTALLYLGNNGYSIVSGIKENSNYTDAYMLRTNTWGQTGCEYDSVFISSNVITQRNSFNNSLVNIYAYDTTITKYDLNPICDTICYPTALNSKMNQKKLCNNNETVNVYPNPANNYFNIDITGIEQSDMLVSIYNYTGSLIYKRLFDKYTISPLNVNVSDFRKGLYLLNIKTRNNIYVKKIIID